MQYLQLLFVAYNHLFYSTDFYNLLGDSYDIIINEY